MAFREKVTKVLIRVFPNVFPLIESTLFRALSRKGGAQTAKKTKPDKTKTLERKTKTTETGAEKTEEMGDREIELAGKRRGIFSREMRMMIAPPFLHTGPEPSEAVET